MVYRISNFINLKKVKTPGKINFMVYFITYLKYYVNMYSIKILIKYLTFFVLSL